LFAIGVSVFVVYDAKELTYFLI